ncbi:dihydrofolate reductase family protein [Nocardia sp. NPDC052566]|uniref:dihydrofolate reductase family protein n=1 Tax=Nocardia sp. NPDC052566 TaxID=3364330 RepID=UPI0037CC216F
MRNLVYYVAVSLDGYIAGPGGEYDFYPHDPDMLSVINGETPEFVPTFVREQVGMPVGEPNKRFDTVLMGRGSYEPGLAVGATNPYAHLTQYVVSSTLSQADYPEVTIVDGDPLELVRKLKQDEGADIWLCGGGTLAAALLGEIDEMIIKSYPVVAGGGISAFTGEFSPTLFVPTRRVEFGTGAQATWFRRA